MIDRTVVVLAPLLALGCMGAQQGHIYSMADGRSATVVAERPSSSSGAIRASLPTGEACHGEFSEVDVNDAARLGACEVPLSANSEASLAVLFCGKDHVLNCTLARRTDDGFSYGACKDRQGNEFSLLF